VGVVQVLGLRAVMGHRDTRALFDSTDICAEHHTDNFAPPIDVFKPYDSEFPLPADTDPGGDPDLYPKSIWRVWRIIEKWGVADVQDVPRLLHCIDRCRDYFEAERFSALRRPNPSAPNSNMLDLILDGPHDVIGNPKAWKENVARVCRYVREQLENEVPGLRQPSAREVEKQLRELYLSLRVIKNATGGPDNPTLPADPS
jgi:hypothetical protein